MKFMWAVPFAHVRDLGLRCYEPRRGQSRELQPTRRRQWLAFNPNIQIEINVRKYKDEGPMFSTTAHTLVVS